MTGSTLIALVFALFAVGAITMLLFASALARRLVESRALSLPPDLLLRMREEWQSELDHLGSSVAQLTFALRLFLTRSQTFIDAASPSDSVEGEGGQVALSVDDLRIVPGPQEFRSALSGDSLTLMVPIAVLIWLHVAAGSLVLASYAWSLVWALVTHLISVRLWGGTPGMLWAGVRIIRWDGSPLEWRHICNQPWPRPCGFSSGSCPASRSPCGSTGAGATDGSAESWPFS
jgi:hypothetical protein